LRYYSVICYEGLFSKEFCMQLSVIGLGKLGSPLAAVFASKGHHVIGVDLNPVFVEKINEGVAPVEEPSLQELIAQSSGRLRATTSYEEAIQHTDVTFVIVPTPSGPDGLFSNTYLIQSLEQIGEALTQKSGYHLVVITSTVTPGSTAGELKTALENASQRSVGETLGLCYNPEFIALGSVVKNMLFPDMLLIGESDTRAGDLLESIYTSVCENTPPIRRMNLVNAEIAKIAVNTFVTTKISYANMLSDICDRLPGADVDVVTGAVGLDSRIGPKYLKGAVAFGGPCFPRDNVALGALARQIGARADLAEATQTINAYQPHRLRALIERKVETHQIAILGLSYKPGTYVVEESQGIQIANQLIRQGYRVVVHDPKALQEAQKHLDPGILSVSSVRECVELSDTLVIMTPWPEFAQELTADLLRSTASVKVIIDCWRMLHREELEGVCELHYLGYGDTLHCTPTH
jgi:UDPglucose 6-dehydrogenase